MRGRAAILGACVALSCAAQSCSLLVSLDGLVGVSTDGGGETAIPVDAMLQGDAAATDGGSPRAERGCPTTGAQMVRVPGGFCIDATEVTKQQYADFLATLPTVVKDGACAFNDTYAIVDYAWTPTKPEAAVAGLDWCDARDYCAWAGKRLCGRKGGGTLDYAASATTDSEWYVACSRGGAYQQPYGTLLKDTPDPMACHTDVVSRAPGTQVAPKTFPLCQVGDSGIYDMVGNVAEWTNACEPVGADAGASRCKVVGGIWYFNASYLSCSFDDTRSDAGVPRNTTGDVGFRCCAD